MCKIATVDMEVGLEMLVYRGLLHTPTTSSLKKKSST